VRLWWIGIIFQIGQIELQAGSQEMNGYVNKVNRAYTDNAP
jgi:hypothetical protein